MVLGSYSKQQYGCSNILFCVRKLFELFLKYKNIFCLYRENVMLVKQKYIYARIILFYVVGRYCTAS